jgi:hypothetical protein
VCLVLWVPSKLLRERQKREKFSPSLSDLYLRLTKVKHLSTTGDFEKGKTHTCLVTGYWVRKESDTNLCSHVSKQDISSNWVLQGGCGWWQMAALITHLKPGLFMLWFVPT